MIGAALVKRLQGKGSTPIAPKPQSVVLSPALLEAYGHIDIALPALVVRAQQIERTQEFSYALVGLLTGGVLMLALISGFVYLVMMGHTGPATTLLGAGVLGIVLAFIRARLRNEQELHTERVLKTPVARNR
jgi:hypothetical protein